MLTEPQIDALLAFLAMLERWNRAFNLTSIRHPDDMLRLHLVDSLSIVAPLRRHLGGQMACLLDVGSGGGLPGVAVAITCPNIEVTCVDAVGKKAGFIRQVASELGLPNLNARHARVESLSTDTFDVLVSRAFSSLANFVSLTRPLRGPNGVWLAMKGRLPLDEIEQLPPDVRVFHVEPLAVPALQAERCLIWLRPVALSA